MVVAAADNCVGRSLIEYGEWSQGEIEVLEQIVQPAMTVLDIGANAGFHTLALSKAIGPAEILITFDPQPAIFQLLAASISLNQLENVHALNIALGKDRGIVDMPQLDYDASQNFGAFDLRSFLKTEQSPLSHMPVSLQRLDDISLARNASVIKMDVEGMELAVLQGATELLRRRRPALLIENNGGEASQKLLQFLFDLDYDCYWQMSRNYRDDNFNKNENNIFGYVGNTNNLAIPSEAVSNIEGLRKVQDVNEYP